MRLSTQSGPYDTLVEAQAAIPALCAVLAEAAGQRPPASEPLPVPPNVEHVEYREHFRVIAQWTPIWPVGNGYRDGFVVRVDGLFED